MAARWKDRWGYVLVWGSMLAISLYLVCRGENTYIEQFDQLDCLVAQMQVLKNEHLFFSGNVPTPALGGLSRFYFPSGWNVTAWLYMLLPTFWAYVAGRYLRILLSILGWHALAGLLIPEAEKYKNLTVLCGFFYGLMPGDSFNAVSFGSLPLLLALLLWIHKDPSWKKLALLFFYPLLSDFSLFGVFICGYLLLFVLGYTVIKKRFPLPLFIALVIISAGYIVFEWPLFYTMLFSGIPSQREEFATGWITLREALQQALHGFAAGYIHSGTLQKFCVTPVCGLWFLYKNGAYIHTKQYKKIVRDRFNIFVLWAAFNAVMFGIDSWQPFHGTVGALLPPLEHFQFSRTLYFNTFVWVFAFYLVLLEIAEMEAGKRRKAFRVSISNSLAVIGVLSIVYGYDYYNNIGINLRNTVKILIGRPAYQATYKEFYAEDLFETIKQDIDYKGENVIAYGFHPAVLYYNGFHTLDGYFSCYPLEYKHKFAELIAPLLEASPDNYAPYFLDWGSRAYVFSVKNETLTGWLGTVVPDDLLIDPQVFREMGGRYVLSAIEVLNAQELGLVDLGLWQDEDSLYQIHVYKLDTA